MTTATEDDGVCFQESPEKKAAWLADAEQRIPVGTRVRVRKSDASSYIGATGTVIEHEVGDIGEWPMVVVRFDKTTRNTTRDGFYCDGSDDDEIEVIKMSDPQDKIDQHRDEAINGLIRTIEATGGLVSERVEGIGDGSAVLVPKGDTEREWCDLADAYLEACRAVGVQPLIDGKRAPKILKITVQLGRALKDDVSDAENENETELLHGMFEKLPEDVEVAVVDCNGVYLYDAHREV